MACSCFSCFGIGTALILLTVIRESNLRQSQRSVLFMRVLVIGAGISGTICGWYLPKADITSSTSCGRAGLMPFLTVYLSTCLTTAGTDSWTMIGP